MNHRIIYPGILQPLEIILMTGSLYSAPLSLAAESLAEGIRAHGKNVSICTPANPRIFSKADQFGPSGGWDYNYDVLILEMGEYMGFRNFRLGDLPDLNITRTVFFTNVMEYSVTPTVELPHEKLRRREVQSYLDEHLPGPVHLARPSLIRLSGAEEMLRDTNSEAIRMIERNGAVSAEMKSRRDDWELQIPASCVPALERPLW